MGKKKTGVRVRVTLDFDFGRFWEDDQTLSEIQNRAETILYNTIENIQPKPVVVGNVSVLLSGGSQ